MVLILDGNSEHVAHVWRNETMSRSKQIPCTIKLHISIYTCSLISGLPSEISTTERNSSVLGENVIHIPTYSLSPGVTVFFYSLAMQLFIEMFMIFKIFVYVFAYLFCSFDSYLNQIQPSYNIYLFYLCCIHSQTHFCFVSLCVKVFDCLIVWLSVSIFSLFVNCLAPMESKRIL